jgi:Glucan phosphorylase
MVARLSIPFGSGKQPHPIILIFKNSAAEISFGALAETLQAESLTRVLYPDDHTAKGQGLRFVQEYFLVASSLADLVRRFRKTNTDWRTLPDKVRYSAQ